VVAPVVGKHPGASRDLEGGLDVAKRKRGAKSVTLRKWVLDLWFPVVRSQLKESSFDSYRRNMVNHVLPRLGASRLTDITPRMLTTMYLELLESGRADGRGGLSPKTVRYIHTTVHKALADAVDDGRLDDNPATRAKRPRLNRRSSRELRFWNERQLARFLERTRDTELEALWHIAAFTGMRRGELMGLQWRDVDFEHRRISVRRNRVCVGHRPVETTPKSHQARVIDVDDRTAQVLHHLHARRPVSTMCDDDLGDADYVFVGANGEPLHPDSVSERFQRAVRAANVPRIRFHDLRHTHATLAIRAGVSPKVIAERLGHHAPEFTMHQYAHVMPGMQAEAAARIADLVLTPRGVEK
jgi:integrase